MLGERSFDELKSLKRELKAWESMFERKHLRRPNKDDVNNAPEEIKETYIKYRNLRKGAESETKQENVKQVEDDEVFRKSLNKSKDSGSANRSIRIQMSPTDFKPIKLCHGQRPKKLSLKNLQEPPTAISKTSEKPEGTSSIATGNDNMLSSEENFAVNNDLGFSITSKRQECMNRPGMMLGRSKVTQRMKRRSVIAADWLEKNNPELSEPSSPTKPDIPPRANSPDNTNKIQDLVPLKETLPSSLSDSVEPSMNSKNAEVLAIGSFSAAEGDLFASKSTTSDAKNSQIVGSKKKSGRTSAMKLNCNEKTSFTKVERVKKPGKTVQNDDFDSNVDQHNSVSVPPADGSMGEDDRMGDLTVGEDLRMEENLRMRENFRMGENLRIGEDLRVEDDLRMEEDLRIKRTTLEPDLGSFSADNVPSQRYQAKVSATKRKRSSVVDESEPKNQQEEPCEEINEKQSKIRKTHSEVEESNAEYLQEDETAKKPSRKKKSSGLVSENFRALNMKVRRYSRRGHGTNYGAYKRKMWKQKQQEKEQGEKKPQWKKTKSTARTKSATSSTTTCFKCGEDGHWVKDCPRNKTRERTTTENWSEPIQAPPDLDIGDEEWNATESKLELLLADRLPRPHNTPVNSPPAIQPLYQAENGNPVSTPKEVYKALNKLGFETFRPGQEEAVMQILCGLSTLVVLSTGAGKSLCYQLPAYMYSKRSPCLTLVISPLVSLMEDQVVGLPFGLCGVSLNTNMTKPQREKAVDQICSGKAAVLLVSPEALVGGNTGPGCLPHVSKLPPIAFACIDEAHCLSQWSHNFRPSYLRVCKVLRERFGVNCFLGLTATATRSTAISVAEHLGITHRPDAIIRGATIPPNLNLSVSSDLNRDRAILELLQGSRFSDCDSIIIYCTRREQTDRLATFLRTCLQKNPMNTSSCITEQNEADEMEEDMKRKKPGRKRKSATTKAKQAKKSVSWAAECYHAGMTAAQRRSVQKKFMSGQLRIVVATVAFGMGLDKANVRAIIHYNLPKTFESYVQEIGRAGRDGLPSHCHVFIDPEGKDVRELRRHAYASTVDRRSIKNLVKQIFPKCDCKRLDEDMKAKRAEQLGSRTDQAHGSLRKQSQDGSGEIGEARFDESVWADDNQEIDDNQVLDYVMKFEIDGCNQNQERLEVNGSLGKGVAGGPNEGEVMEELKSERMEKEPLIESIQVLQGEPDVDPVVEEENGNECCDADPKCARVCGGHEVALPIEKSVQDMDMKEEGIATLLCYLELHANKWVQILQPVRSTCTLKFYGGPAHLHFVAQKVPIVTAAVAYARERGEFKRNTSNLTFPVVEIVDKMGWDLEPARRELYALQWNDSLRLAKESGLSAGHSGILVEFTDLAFHLRAPGDLSDDERDEVCDFLEDRILAQERSQVHQLHGVWSTFNERAHPNCWQSAEECDKNVDEQLKSVVLAYFESENDPTKSELETLAEARKNCQFVESKISSSEEAVNWDGIARDIRSFLNQHDDCEISGRAIARIFHGIDSPCFPAAVWGRDRRFWRRHLDVDFNLLRKFAIKELVKFR